MVGLIGRGGVVKLQENGRRRGGRRATLLRVLLQPRARRAEERTRRRAIRGQLADHVGQVEALAHELDRPRGSCEAPMQLLQQLRQEGCMHLHRRHRTLRARRSVCERRCAQRIVRPPRWRAVDEITQLRLIHLTGDWGRHCRIGIWVVLHEGSDIRWVPHHHGCGPREPRLHNLDASLERLEMTICSLVIACLAMRHDDEADACLCSGLSHAQQPQCPTPCDHDIDLRLHSKVGAHQRLPFGGCQVLVHIQVLLLPKRGATGWRKRCGEGSSTGRHRAQGRCDLLDRRRVEWRCRQLLREGGTLDQVERTLLPDAPKAIADLLAMVFRDGLEGALSLRAFDCGEEACVGSVQSEHAADGGRGPTASRRRQSIVDDRRTTDAVSRYAE